LQYLRITASFEASLAGTAAVLALLWARAAKAHEEAMDAVVI